jgi:multiple sugar transport system permease protein
VPGAFIFLAPALGILVALILFPLVYSFWTSLNYIFYTQSRFVGLDNYVELLTSAFFWGNTVYLTCIFVAVCVTAELLIGFGLAMLANREVRGIRLLSTLLVLPMMFPQVSVAYTWRYLFVWGIINHFLNMVGIPDVTWIGTDPTLSMLSLMIVEIWQWTPLAFLILLTGLRGVPQDILEAVKIDGASAWATFRYIILPLMKRIVLVVVLLRTMDAFKVFDIVYVLTAGGPGVSTDIFSYDVYRKGFLAFNYGTAAAESYILIIILSVLVLLFYRVMKED